MYKRNNNYQSGGSSQDHKSKVDKLSKKYKVDYNTLEKSISQEMDGLISYETTDGEKHYHYCTLTNEWFLDKKDPARKKLLNEREKKLEQNINSMYMIKPTTQLPDVTIPK